MNIIIPLGGIGSRFKKEGHTFPKPLINILGKEMIFYVLDNIQLNEDDSIYIIYKTELDKWNFTETINNKYKHIKFIPLHYQTKGAAETLLYGLNHKNYKDLTKRIITLDCDNFYTCDILNIFRQQNNFNNAVFCFKDIQDKPIFSYIKFNKDFKISDIKEKEKISDFANTGCYCFESGNILKQYCKEVIDKNILEKGEYYISNVIKLMIKNNLKFKANVIDINDYYCLGTPHHIKIFCKNYKKGEIKRFCFDLDNTLVSYPKIKGDYTSVIPIEKNINMCRYLKQLGHTIIIHTARRMRTHNGNIGRVVQDIGEITINTLKKFNIPYDELLFGKPYAHFYIDDKCVNAYNDLEKDLGFYNTYTQSRNFNRLETKQLHVRVKQGPKNIIEGEIHWYKNIPQIVKHLFPLFINNDNEKSYTMENIKGIDLKYLYTHESLSEEILLKYLNCIDSIHMSQNDIDIDNKLIYLNYSLKIKKRYESFNYSKYSDSTIVYDTLINYFNNYEKENQGTVSVIHGDPILSNCVLDEHKNFKFIDMRGKLGDILTIYGDKWYDYGKIYQSLIGYDEILENIVLSSDYKKRLIDVFKTYIIKKFDIKTLKKIKMITNSLLFSLIPLHDNEKCYKYYNLIDFNLDD